MKKYEFYFKEKEELLKQLEELHSKKQKLKELIREREDMPPYVVELSGLPRTGKTESLDKIYNFFKYGEIPVEKAEEPAFLIKEKMTIQEIKKMSNLDFNDKTLKVSKNSLLKSIRKNPKVILMDRGVIDNYFWYQMMLSEGTISKEVYIDRMKNLKDDLEFIDRLFVMSADPEVIITRDYINQIYLDDRTKTTLEKVSHLKQGQESLVPRIEGLAEEKVKKIDTTNISEMDTSILITNNIVSSMIKKYTL